ncbi:tetratricopeptide repeat protein [Streptomyces sp. 3MP-14]|uniref:Tetratricopeptide repeat protein n=1 Tax=Streptomyces mimosae TaxID=2586635 RepID=A0A5N6A1R4_9ACTN|nr:MULTISPECIES: FxSxx-COOH system tetratricopeptide repeat protein [Streptomyces]KAB8161826.1 tetratricopeptide repeat protein [Streptomyces mimosae]KAB8174906.1 tetratricopeptide repeat protein [Streptomyces sp. 3MP-14]
MTSAENVSASGERSIAAGSNPGVMVSGDGTRVDQRTLVVAPGALAPGVEADELARLHNLPRVDSEVFEGRGEELAALPPGGAGMMAQAVRGMGGVGKSTLVLHHARAHLAAGGGPVWWVVAENPEQVVDGLARLAAAVSPVHAALPLEEAADWAVTWLQGRTGWLVVLDNVNDPDDIAPWLGRLGTGRVLVTTRRDVPWPGMSTVLRLDPLHPDASLTVLRGVAGENVTADENVWRELAEELGHLPLALQQAGAYLAQTRTAPVRYLQRLRADPAGVLATSTPGGPHQRTIARLWSVTLDTLDNTSPDAVALLRILAYCAPTPLPRDVLDTALTTREEVDQALGLLLAYSLINLTNTTVTVHRLLQTVVRSTAPQPAPCASRRRRYFPWRRSATPSTAPPDPSATMVTLLLDTALEQNPREVDAWPYWQALLPHIRTATAYHSAAAMPNELSALLGRAGNYLTARGQAMEGLPLLERALAIAEATQGPDHPDTAQLLNGLAETFNNLGRHSDTLLVSERALAIAEVTLGLDHFESAAQLHNLASAFSALGRHAEALPPAKRALTIVEATLGPDHSTTARVLGNLASIFAAMGRYSEALPLAERALAIIEATLRPDHPDTARALGHLARTLSDLGRYADVLPLRERALAIAEATLGSDHPDTAVLLGNLACTFTDLGRYADAQPLEERALAIAEATLGSDHPDTAERVNNLASTFSDLGRHSDALPLRKRALAITEATLGPEHPTTAERLNNLASLFFAMGRHSEALPLAERALTITEATLGPDHPATAERLNNLAILFFAMGRGSEALPLAERALTITEATLGSEHPTTAQRLGNLASIFAAVGRGSEALPLAERALTITEATLGSEHPTTARYSGNLAGIFFVLGRYSEALPLAEQALTITEAKLGPDHPATAPLLKVLALLGRRTTECSDGGS